MNEVIVNRIVRLLEARKRYREANPITVNPFTLEPGFEPPDVYPVAATVDEIEDFEAQYCTLSADIKEWLLITNGAAGFFGLDSAQRGCRISEVWTYFPEWKELGWIPLGRDDFGNYYVSVELPDQRRTVAFIEGLDADTICYAVATDALHLALFKLMEWAALCEGIENPPWPFDKEHVLKYDPELADMGGVIVLPWEAD